MTGGRTPKGPHDVTTGPRYSHASVRSAEGFIPYALGFCRATFFVASLLLFFRFTSSPPPCLDPAAALLTMQFLSCPPHLLTMNIFILPTTVLQPHI